MIQISICFHQKYRFQCNIETCIFSKSTLLLFDSDISGNVSAIALSINPCILTSSDFTTQTLDPWSNQYMFKGLIRDLFSKREIHSDLVVPLLILGFSPGICNGRVELLLFLSVKSHWKLRLMHLYVTTVLPSRHGTRKRFCCYIVHARLRKHINYPLSVRPIGFRNISTFFQFVRCPSGTYQRAFGHF